LTGDESPDNNDESEVFEFDCPECGTHIVGAVSKCPKCGVEFIIEEVEEFRCPECGEIIPVDATECPSCGLKFEMTAPKGPEELAEKGPEEAHEEPTAEPEVVETPEEPTEPPVKEPLKDEFPRLVAEVKPMMALAREFGVDTTHAKVLIDKAVTAGKKGNLGAAVERVRESKASIESSIRDRVENDLKDLEDLKVIADKMGEDPSSIEESEGLVGGELEKGDLKSALTHAKEGMKRAESLTGKYIEAQNMVRDLEKILENAERFYIDVSEVRLRLEEARAAEANGDYSMMGIMARKGREQIMYILPDEIREELKRSKLVLMDAKAEGKDVNIPVKLLKEAASALNRERYDEALEKLVEFRSDIRRI